MTEVLVLAELTDGRLDPIAHELLAAGRSLGSVVTAAVIGGSAGEAVADDAISHGADRVYLVRDPLLNGAAVEAQLAALEHLCRQIEPSVLLVGRTPLGTDLAPRLAVRLGVGLAQDCIELGLDAETGRVVARRPVYGGNAVAEVTFPTADPQMALVRAKVYEPLEADASRSGETVVVEPNLDPSVVRVRSTQRVRQEAQGVRLEDASIVVSGGRGLGGPEGFERLDELAGLLGGAVGASRAACDAGWRDHSYQVGLTGKTITPALYITVAISGASQHMAGCSGAKNIVAINQDANANIFKECRYGVVGDWNKVMPSFVETVRELVKS
jgi:electron transfer flavoprotein alpha subunit